jgi:predicted nucleotidyltransferase component of viral defense system
MTQKKNAAASVKQRLLNVGKKSGEDFQSLLTRYAGERLLYRLGASEYTDGFVLKGAMLFVLWTGAVHRPTRDIDLLGFGENTGERLATVFRSLCARVEPDDGLVFLPETVTVQPIRDDDEYGGQRVAFAATLGQARVALQVDVGFGDAITPAAQLVEYPTLLGMPAPNLRAYPPETVVAEKVEALVKLGLTNSRMKDFYDLLVLARTFAFEGEQVRIALTNTFTRRQTAIPTAPPVALTAAFTGDATKQKQWKAFVKRSSLAERVGELGEVMADVSAFVLPPLLAAASGGPFEVRWKPGGQWE